MYKILFKYSTPELIREYTLAVVIGCCCPLQSSLIPSYVMGTRFLSLLELTFWNHM